MPVSWSAGNKIVIASTGHRHSQIENEERTIDTISVTGSLSLSNCPFPVSFIDYHLSSQPHHFDHSINFFVTAVGYSSAIVPLFSAFVHSLLYLKEG